jgi:hypothetical protein
MAGGLVGLDTGAISNSFATGRVRSEYGGPAISGGGLVGYLADTGLGPVNTFIVNSYATGAVIEVPDSGGLVGWASSNDLVVETSYSTGKVTGQYGSNVGGFAGVGCECFSNDDWDITTSTRANSVGNGDSTGITGLTSTQLQSGLPAGFDSKVWAQNRKINRGFPYLITNPPPQ